MNECVSLGDAGAHLEYAQQALNDGIEARCTALMTSTQPLGLIDELMALYQIADDQDSMARCSHVRSFLDGAQWASIPWSPSATSTNDLEGHGRQLLFDMPDDLAELHELYVQLWPLLAELHIEPMPAGTPRLSRRSFRTWQESFRKLEMGLGVSGTELWNGGRALRASTGRYLPQVALLVPLSNLESEIDRAEAHRLGSLVVSLKVGGVLLDTLGAESVAQCFRYAAGAPGALNITAKRFQERVRKMSSRTRSLLAKMFNEDELETDRFERMRSALALTSAKHGLLASGDINASLAALLGDTSGDAVDANARLASFLISEPARSLAAFYLHPAYGHLTAASEKKVADG